MKYLKGPTFYILTLVVILFLLGAFLTGGNVENITYTEFLDKLSNGEITEVLVDSKVAEITDVEEIEYTVNISSEIVLGDVLDEYRNINPAFNYDFVEDKDPSWFITVVLPIVLVIFAILFLVYIMQQSQSGGGGKVMSFGKSKARISNPEDKKKTTFEDVAGAEEEKEELAEIVDFLKSPKKFIELGARIPKGVLLVGPPGTGKTLLAKAISGEAGVPFYSISGSDFVEMFVGVGASRVRDLFEQSKKTAPCIVFIDEIDAVGRRRGAGLGGGHDEREQTLNQLLVEMDGFGLNEGVIILAATNRPDILDPALLRPGRFDRRVYVGLPDIKGREAIMKVHSKGKPLSDEVNLNDLAKITPGFTGADIENLLNEAALLTARRDKKVISMAEIKEAVFKVTMGPEKKSRIINDVEKKLTAYHEAGHAISIRVVSTTDKVDRVSIIPAGLAGGYTSFKPDEDKNYHTKSQLLESIVIALGGKAAEALVLGEVSTGAGSDLRSANTIARNMVTKYGMSDTLGNMIFGDENDEVFIGRDYGHTRNYSEKLAAEIDNEIKKIIDECYDRAYNILNDNITKLHKLAEELLVKEKIEGEEFERIFTDS